MSDILAIQSSRKTLIEGKAEARAKAAQTITSRASQLFKDVPSSEAARILIREVCAIDEQLLRNTAAVFRRGGLVCIRAMCAGLPAQALGDSLLTHLLDPVLCSMADADPIVRIAAIEACYELVRQHGVEALQARFTDLFTALSVAVGDRDKRVFLLAEEVSCVLKDAVSRSGAAAVDMTAFTAFVSHTLGNYTSASGALMADVTSAVPQWVLNWLRFVMELPGCHFEASMAALLRVLLAASVSDNASVFDALREYRQDVARYYASEASADVCEVLGTLSGCIHTTSSARTRVFCLDWIGELVPLGVKDEAPQRYLPRVLPAVLPQLSSKDGTTLVAASRANQAVQDALVSLEGGVGAGVAELLLRNALEQLSSSVGEESQMGVLEWLLVLYHLAPAMMEAALAGVLESVVALMDDASDGVAQRAVEVACLITGDGHFSDVVELVLRRLLSHSQGGLLLSRFPTVVRKFHSYRAQSTDGHAPRTCVLVHFAERLANVSDLRLVSKVVLSLHAILVTFPEFDDIRAVLRRGLADATTAELFAALATCWRYNAVAFLSLGLMCRHFTLTRRVCEHLGEAELSIATYVQLDHLVQQLESPAFTFLRVSLLHPSFCPALLQTMHVLLLLLPQSSPHYELLYRRLQPTTALITLEAMSGTDSNATASLNATVGAAEWNSFVAAQRDLLQYEQAMT